MPIKNSRIRIFAGPNGSGKSTVLRKIQRSFYSGPFVNADLIEASLNQKGFFNSISELDLVFSDEDFQVFREGNGKSWILKSQKEKTPITLFTNKGLLFTKNNPNSYDAAMAADFLREMLLKKGDTFSYETVLSHPSKLAFFERAKQLGFKNYLYFICTVDPAINLERVGQREKLGGHHVPKSKIISRYFESLTLLKDIIPLCHRIYFFDNSASNPKHEIKPVAEISDNGKLILNDEMVPNWLEQFVIRPVYM